MNVRFLSDMRIPLDVRELTRDWSRRKFVPSTMSGADLCTSLIM